MLKELREGEVRSVSNRRWRRAAIGLAVLAVLVGALLVAWPQLLPGKHGPVARVPLPSFTRIDLPKAEPSDAKEVPDGPEPPVIDAEEAAEFAALTTGRRGVVESAGSRGEIPRPSLITTSNAENPSLAESTGLALGTEAIVMRKAVRINGREAGSLPIHIDSRSRLLVKPGDLRVVMVRAGVQRSVPAPRGGETMVSFSELRADGLSLRYDPDSDSVVITAG